MYFAKSVKALTTYVYNLIYPTFNVRMVPQFDETLGFDTQIHRFIIEQTQAERDKDWIFMFWNRQQIHREVDQPREFLFKVKNESAGTGKDYSIILGKAAVTICFYSNSLDYIEALEESLAFDFPPNLATAIPVNFEDGILNETTIMIKAISSQSLEKQERATKDGMVILTFGCDIQFPIIKFRHDCKLITQIKFKIEPNINEIIINP